MNLSLSKESEVFSTVIKDFTNRNLSTQNSELDFSITLTSEQQNKHDQKQISENNNINIMFANIAQQQADNLNAFTQNLANLFNTFLNRLG